MRVVFDHQTFSWQIQGGVSRYFAELLTWLTKQDCSVRVPLAFTGNRYLHNFDPVRYKDWLQGKNFKGKAYINAFLNQIVSSHALKKNDWDVLHPTYYHPYFIPFLKGRPFVLTIHDMTHELFPDGFSDIRKTPARKASLATMASHIITPSQNTKNDVVRLLKVPEDKISVIPHGNSFRPGAVLPKKPECESGYWLYVGGRDDYKNWNFLILTLRLRANKTDRLVMVGGGPLSALEKKALFEAGLEGRWQQTNANEAELAGWYQSAKALVYPSKYEGFGLPLLEAMAWGCPAVVANASSLPEVGGSAAVYFDLEKPESLLDCLETMENVSEREACIAAGVLQEKNFSWERSASTTLSVYQKLLTKA